jgi:hypothetical protein
MEKTVYIHYGASVFDSAKGFPIKNRPHWNKPVGGLWASREAATFGWRDWCEGEEPDWIELSKFFRFTLRDGAKVGVIHSIPDLCRLPTVDDDLFWWSSEMLDFEECLRQGWDAIELCWYGEEYKDQRGTDDMYYGLYGWDCDCILILNPDVVVQI